MKHELNANANDKTVNENGETLGRNDRNEKGKENENENDKNDKKDKRKTLHLSDIPQDFSSC